MWDPGELWSSSLLCLWWFLEPAGTVSREDLWCHTTRVGWQWGDVAAGDVQAAGAALAALQGAPWPCPQRVFLLMPRQAELNREKPTEVSGILCLGCPACARGGAGQALQQGRCRNALPDGEESR